MTNVQSGAHDNAKAIALVIVVAENHFENCENCGARDSAA